MLFPKNLNMMSGPGNLPKLGFRYFPGNLVITLCNEADGFWIFSSLTVCLDHKIIDSRRGQRIIHVF
ncbi:MAG: hypothetical protein CM1200mP30_16510 [Pseudomonadota bacterium]|nr:MAG: hypothetical protein CM1200mP30_16510 [Pseudomonadota bacterium]